MSQWRYQLVFEIGYLQYKFQLPTVFISWDTKGGCTLSSTHTILEEMRALVWLARYCVHAFLILCVTGVHNPLFSQLSDMGMNMNFLDGCHLLKDDNCWLMRKSRNLSLVVCAEVKSEVKILWKISRSQDVSNMGH